jgi:hypothetical protein
MKTTILVCGAALALGAGFAAFATTGSDTAGGYCAAVYRDGLKATPLADDILGPFETPAGASAAGQNATAYAAHSLHYCEDGRIVRPLTQQEADAL